MRRGLFIGAEAAPAIGDVRAAGSGYVIFVYADAPTRRDWPRYADALTIALARGAEIITGVAKS